LTPEQTPVGLRGDFVALSVTDNGCGIAPDILSLVFDPFFTTKGANKGSGLGLSQVHGFAHQSRGTVTISSELGRGTCVTLYLPRAIGEAKKERDERDGVIDHREGGTVLVVEDNPEVAKITEQMVRQLGYRVQRAESAATALELAGQVRFQLVISDIVMAGSMDGVGLARALRQQHPELPIVLVTGYSSSATAAELEFAVLRKPFELSRLSRAIAKATAETNGSGSDNVIRLRRRTMTAPERQRTPDDEARERPGHDDQGPDAPA
jgi:CheY-like chemotaxis protein